MENEKKKRIRRTKADLEKDLWNAAEKLITEGGFPRITVAKLMRNTRADLHVFYNRYVNIEEYQRFLATQLNDKWAAAVKVDDEKNPIENLKDIATQMIDLLATDKMLQKLLAWELNETNEITHYSVSRRSQANNLITSYFNKELPASGINNNIVLSLIMGGIYYIMLSSHMGPFNQVDFSKTENVTALKATINLLIDRITYNANPIEDERKRIARNLLKENVSPDVICKSTGLSMEELGNL